MQSHCRKDAACLKRRPSFAELCETSTSEQLVAWLLGILGEELLTKLDLDDVEASDVLACENEEACLCCRSMPVNTHAIQLYSRMYGLS